jgi:hypothetical protein
MFRSHALAAVLVLVPVLAGAGAAFADPPAGQPVDGIRCERMESGVFHIHQHVAIYDRGKAVSIPDDVGRPLLGACLYWLHTHTADGLVHIESPTVRTFRLGEFFDLWGERLDATHLGPVKIAKGALRVYVGGQLYSGDPRKIELSQHADIVLEAGPPYPKPTPFTAWNGQ